MTTSGDGGTRGENGYGLRTVYVGVIDGFDHEEGDEIVAHCIPNYIDKRDEIPLEEVREQIEGALGQEIAESYIEEIKGGATVVEAKKADAATPAEAAAPAAAEGKAAEGKAE